MKVKKVTRIIYDSHNRPVEFVGDDDKHYDYETALELIDANYFDNATYYVDKRGLKIIEISSLEEQE